MLEKNIPICISILNTSINAQLAIFQQVTKTYWDTWHAVWRHRA